MSDCGCPPAVVAPTGCPTPVTICAPEYLSLIIVPRLRLLGVNLGSQCQAFLGNTPPIRGFVFDDGSGMGQYVEPAPSLTLPIWNPIAAAGPPPTYGTPGPFPFLLAGIGGANPHAWRFVTGPGGVPALLQWNGSGFEMVDIGSIPGVAGVCAADLTAAKVKVLGCVMVDGVPVLRKLFAINQKVVVGDVDGDGLQGFKCLPDDSALSHPIAIFPALTVETFKERNADDTAIPEGLPLQVTYGAGSSVTGVLCVYDPATFRFLRLAPTTKEKTDYGADVQVNDDGTWHEMGGHCKIESKVYNHPDVQVIAAIRTNMVITGGDPNQVKNFNMDFAIFVDGAEIFTIALKGQKDNTVNRLLTGLTRGVHTIDIRVRKTAVADQKLHILSSNMDVFTVL